MNNFISINGRLIGQDFPPYIIAEMSANHNGKIENAFDLIREAKNAGADALKMQTYHPDLLTLKLDLPDFQITEGLWAGKTLHQLYSSAFTPWEWHKPLFDFAKKNEITIFSSPFDKTAVDLLENLGAPAYKIASFEMIDLDLIKYVASTGKPLIISTGMASLEEICEAVDIAKESGCQDLALLHCVSGYPAPAGDYNLRTIPDMICKFPGVIGLSDHTLSNATSIASIALGASIIEKHFSLNRNAGGVDDIFSITPDELKNLCVDSKIVWESMGNINYSRKSSELANVKFRRSLYFVKDCTKGSVVTESDIKSIRPGFGLHPKYYHSIIGKKLVHDVSKGKRVSHDDFF
jgi:pseudaminic acid synthase